MQPVDFFELGGLDQFHYMSGMFWFIGKYSTMFCLNLIYKTSFWFFNGSFRLIWRTFGSIRNFFNAGVGNQINDVDREDWELDDEFDQ